MNFPCVRDRFSNFIILVLAVIRGIECRRREEGNEHITRFCNQFDYLWSIPGHAETIGIVEFYWNEAVVNGIFVERLSTLGNAFKETALRPCETPPSPPTPDPVGIENCKQLFSPLLAFTTKKKQHILRISSPLHVLLFFWVVNATRNEKSCLQLLILTAVFHMLLRHIHNVKFSSNRMFINTNYDTPIPAMIISTSGNLRAVAVPNIWETD